jgi:hypothetical protein
MGASQAFSLIHPVSPGRRKPPLKHKLGPENTVHAQLSAHTANWTEFALKLLVVISSASAVNGSPQPNVEKGQLSC